MRFLALIASSATLLCCGLPALLVFMGFGAVVASLVSSLPILVTLSQHKIIIFGGSAMLILLSWFMSNRATSCPINEYENSCQQLKKTTRIILIASTVLWAIGFSSAFVLPKILSLSL